MKRVFILRGKEPYDNYRAALEACGLEVVESEDLSLAAACDGLLLPGGGDADPALYGQEDRGSHPPDHDRDRDELRLIREFCAMDKPVFGICRGAQMLNIALGGTLIQDLSGERHRYDEENQVDRIHKVAAVHPMMAELYGGEFSVNSCHHQAVDRPGEGLSPLCVGDDGVVEGIIHESGRMLGVQFHPERMAFACRREDTVDGAALFRRFAELL